MGTKPSDPIEPLLTEWRDKPLQERLSLLRDRWCDENLLKILYGLQVDEDWLGLWRSWARKQPIEKTDKKGRLYDRHRLETFFQQEQLVPVQLGALRLGMTDESLREILRVLQERGLSVRPPYVGLASEQLVDENLIKGFSGLLAATRFRTFSDINSYCRRIHTAVKDELGVEVAAVMCPTAQELREEDYAQDRDVLDARPMSLAYQVWLDLGKPINLKPDACSTLFYVQHEETLSPLVFAGVQPEVPEQLRKRKSQQS